MQARRIAIIGAGVGGSAAAAFLHRAGHQVTLFERFSVPKPVGSGLVIQPVGLAVLDALGAGDTARAHGAAVARMQGNDGARRVLAVSYPAEAPGLAMHRASLFHALWQVVQGLGVPVVTDAVITEAPVIAGERRLSGDHGAFDLVVDAAGAGSPLSPLKARALPFGAIWGHVPWPAGTTMKRDELAQAYQGAARMAGILPIGPLPGDDTPRAAVFWSMPVALLEHWPQADLAAWKAEVTGLWPAMALFLEGITTTAQMTTARYTHGTLARLYGPAIVHIGDAAHRASPQLGQGANMALLDAAALASAIATNPWEDALPAYGRMRRWHVRSYQALSAAFTPMYQSDSRILPALRNHLLAPASEWPIVRQMLTRLVAGNLLHPLAGGALPKAPLFAGLSGAHR
jgi:2-polyprenyl-6-methoxyphenol hydroxylase-like FAD-dependent oxidoreductase